MSNPVSDFFERHPGPPTIVRVGPAGGARYVGPFSTTRAAVEWREQHVTAPGQSWAIVGLIAPDAYEPYLFPGESA